MEVLQFCSLQGIKSYRLFFILIDDGTKKIEKRKIYLFMPFLAPNFRRFSPFLAPNFRRFNLFLAPNFRKISIFASDYQRVTNYEKISKKTYRQRT